MAGLDTGIPTQAICRIRICAGEIGVPTVTNARAVAITPIHIPIINCTGAVIFNANGRCVTTAPIAGNHITTTGICGIACNGRTAAGIWNR